MGIKRQGRNARRPHLGHDGWQAQVAQDALDGLRALGCGIVTVAELDLAGAPDSRILERAVADGRVVLTMNCRRRRRSCQPTTGAVRVPA